MESLEAELERARDLDPSALADAIESIGFECTRCGGCCKGEAEEPHTATVFPDEVRALQAAGADSRNADGDSPAQETEYDWRDVARPMPYGLEEGADGLEGETFEWALQTDDCGDCRFYEERTPGGDGPAESAAETAPPDDATTGNGYCTVHEDRPLICRTYPFSVALGGTSQPMGEAVDEAGMVRAHECEGLGREIDRDDALELAEALRERAIRELEEAIAVRDRYEPATTAPGDVVVHDSEGRKSPDGTSLE